MTTGGGTTMRMQRRDDPTMAGVGEGDGRHTRSTGEWLHAAATPVLSVMALSTALADSPADLLCPAGHGRSPLGGMTLMYVLMAVFHAEPWLNRLRAFWHRRG